MITMIAIGCAAAALQGVGLWMSLRLVRFLPDPALPRDTWRAPAEFATGEWGPTWP